MRSEFSRLLDENSDKLSRLEETLRPIATLCITQEHKIHRYAPTLAYHLHQLFIACDTSNVLGFKNAISEMKQSIHFLIDKNAGAPSKRFNSKHYVYLKQEGVLTCKMIIEDLTISKQETEPFYQEINKLWGTLQGHNFLKKYLRRQWLFYSQLRLNDGDLRQQPSPSLQIPNSRDEGLSTAEDQDEKLKTMLGDPMMESSLLPYKSLFCGSQSNTAKNILHLCQETKIMSNTLAENLIITILVGRDFNIEPVKHYLKMFLSDLNRIVETQISSIPLSLTPLPSFQSPPSPFGDPVSFESPVSSDNPPSFSSSSPPSAEYLGLSSSGLFSAFTSGPLPPPPSQHNQLPPSYLFLNSPPAPPSLTPHEQPVQPIPGSVSGVRNQRKRRRTPPGKEKEAGRRSYSPGGS